MVLSSTDFHDEQQKEELGRGSCASNRFSVRNKTSPHLLSSLFHFLCSALPIILVSVSQRSHQLELISPLMHRLLGVPWGDFNKTAFPSLLCIYVNAPKAFRCPPVLPILEHPFSLVTGSCPCSLSNFSSLLPTHPTLPSYLIPITNFSNQFFECAGHFP